MKRNVMFAVFLWMIAFKNPLAADRALSAISPRPRESRCFAYFVITGILTTSWLPSAYCMSRI